MKKISVVCTRHDESDAMLKQLLKALSKQQKISLQVWVLDQQYSSAIEQYALDYTNKSIEFIYKTISETSISKARNYALEQIPGDILIFTDPDVIPQPDWGKHLIGPLDEPDIAITGGKILPQWEDTSFLTLYLRKPSLLREQYSLMDKGDASFPVTKVIGCSLAIDRKKIASLRFPEHLGRRDGMLLGGEETSLCRMVAEKGYKVQYVGMATVYHHIPAHRLRFRWMSRRMYDGGRTRWLSRKPSGENGTSYHVWDYLVLPFFTPQYLSGYFLERLRQKKNQDD